MVRNDAFYVYISLHPVKVQMVFRYHGYFVFLREGYTEATSEVKIIKE